MKHTFKICYELDVPLAIAVALYLDAEHYLYLHRHYLGDKIEILKIGNRSFESNQFWHVLGLCFGQTSTAEYVPPATFLNHSLKPYPRWLPSIHSFVRTKTTLRYFPTSRDTTLSEATVELEMPRWLYPFRRFMETTIEKLKILKDLEDVALADRRAKLFGRNSNDAYLLANQFLLNKADYAKYFGKNSVFYGSAVPEYADQQWTNIKDLDRPYVRDFMKRRYHRYTNFPPTKPATT